MEYNMEHIRIESENKVIEELCTIISSKRESMTAFAVDEDHNNNNNEEK